MRGINFCRKSMKHDKKLAQHGNKSDEITTDKENNHSEFLS